MASFKVSQQAEEDLADIFEAGVVNFGFDTAVRYHDRLERIFELLVSAPQIARLRIEYDPPVRVYPVGAHIVVYSVQPGGTIEIIRVRHGREDWTADPAGRE